MAGRARSKTTRLKKLPKEALDAVRNIMMRFDADIAVEASDDMLVELAEACVQYSARKSERIKELEEEVERLLRHNRKYRRTLNSVATSIVQVRDHLELGAV